MMILKPLLTDKFLQLAVLVTFLRFSYDDYEIGLLHLATVDNGTGWNASPSGGFLRHHHFVHPKSPDLMLLQDYESDMFEKLNSLGRYNRYGIVPNNDVLTYLLTAVNKTEETIREPEQDTGGPVLRLQAEAVVVDDGLADLGLTQEVRLHILTLTCIEMCFHIAVMYVPTISLRNCNMYLRFAKNRFHRCI